MQSVGFMTPHLELCRTANALAHPSYLDLPEEIWHAIIAGMLTADKSAVALACRRSRVLQRATVTVLRLPSRPELGPQPVLTTHFPSIHTLMVTASNNGFIWSAKELIDLLRSDTALGQRLRHLHLCRCSNVTDVTLLAIASAAPNLRTVELATTPEAHGPSSLAPLASLSAMTKLSVSHLRLIRPNALSSLAAIKNLKRLALTACTLSMPALQGLPVIPGLTALEFMDCDVHRTHGELTRHVPQDGVPAAAAAAIADEVMAVVAAAPLHYANANSFRPASPGAVPLPRSLLLTSSLARLKLHHWTLHAEEFESLSGLPRLELLFVGKLKLERPTRHTLPALKSLETDCVISGFSHLPRACPNLTSLSCEATDEMLLQLPQMTQLRALGLWGYCGAVSESGLSHLVALSQLERFKAEKLSALTNRQLTALASAHPRLRTLDLSYCDTINDFGVVLALARCQSLVNARFLKCSAISATAIAALAGVPTVRCIKVLYCPKVAAHDIEEVRGQLAQAGSPALIKFHAPVSNDDDNRLSE